VTEPGPLHALLSERFKDAIGAGWQDPPFEILRAKRGAIRDIAAFLQASHGFTMLMDLTAVDYLTYRSAKASERFELVYYFFDLPRTRRLRIKVAVPDTDPTAPSLAPLFGSADWLEREVWDMYGIRFDGHPNLKRLLMYEEFSGHPLRKDYPLLKQQPRVRQVHPGVPPFGEKPVPLKAGEEEP
jgi:NADH-quinone oxidoreductase subunit C